MTLSNSSQQALIEQGSQHVGQIIFDARLNLLRRQAKLQQTLAIYSDPTDYRRPGWEAVLSSVSDHLSVIDTAIERAYQQSIEASHCGNCSRRDQEPHPAHTSPCTVGPCPCERTIRLQEVRA